MKISENGIAFIRDHEGCVLTAYQDGGGVWTIGVGHPTRRVLMISPGMNGLHYLLTGKSGLQVFLRLVFIRFLRLEMCIFRKPLPPTLPFVS